MGRIKYLVMDVDGTLTDGKIYMGQDGEIAKAFDIKDGCGILLILPKFDIKPVIITARRSTILENRCKEIGIKELHQGVSTKLSKLKEIVGDDFSSVAYVGDDLPDIPCMEAVKKDGGYVMCPADAIPEIKALSDFISGFKAGDGAIRDCINYLIQCEEDSLLITRIKKAIDCILSEDFSEKTSGLLSDGSKYSIIEYFTKSEKDCIIESHKSHIDIQYMLEGKELIKLYSNTGLTSAGQYNKKDDIELWQNGVEISNFLLLPGSLIVVQNNVPHKGAISNNMVSCKVRKLICKIKIK